MDATITMLIVGAREGSSKSLTTKRSIDATQLEELLTNPTPIAPSQWRLFVVQSPSQVYDTCTHSKLREVLQTKLNVPSAVLHAQRWSQTTFRFSETINCPRLPTTTIPRTKFSLEYFELWDVVNSDFFTYHAGNASSAKCVVTGRQIQCHKWSTKSGWLLIVPRKCSFWWDKRNNGRNGTYHKQDIPCVTSTDLIPTAVVLCDPPPSRVLVNGVELNLELRAFEGGYHGFIPESVDNNPSENPPHTSLLNDLVYYVQNHAEALRLPGEPESAAVFLRKIVASHYCQLLGFVSHQTAAMRSSGWAVQRRTQKEIDESNQVETAWSHFKCPEYLEALSSAFDALGIPQGGEPYDAFRADADALLLVQDVDGPANPTQLHSSDWRSSAPDFLYLHREFRQRLADYARMTSSLAALNGMIGGRLSMMEARTARSLTLVAMLFAPPACVASILSIPRDGPQFGIYWAAAVPLTIIVFLLTYLVHERDVVKRVWRARRPREDSGLHTYDDASTKV